MFFGYDCATIWRGEASGYAVGQEPAQAASVAMGVGDWGRRHEVSILSFGEAGERRCLGCCPRKKVSMIRMRPPQQGQGCSGAFVSSGLALTALMAG